MVLLNLLNMSKKLLANVTNAVFFSVELSRDPVADRWRAAPRQET